jgi:23S rRNA pseudouridine1911/1915/1917 synthase
VGHATPAAGTIHTRIGRSARDRKKMAALPLTSNVRRKYRYQDEICDDEPDQNLEGREAITHYQVEETFALTSLVRCRIETGRTHQIRVHLAHLRHPVVGDAVYGRAHEELPAPADRQMLHAEKLTIDHPVSGERLTFTAPLPADFQSLLDALRKSK